MEFVLVVPRSDLFLECYPQGFMLDGEIDTKAFLDRAREKAFFIERRVAETDPSLQQIIPYCLVCKPESREIFLMRRLSTQGEKRLHGKLSVGVGGHINPIDLDEGEDVINAGLRRELEEEVAIEGEEKIEILGIMNDDSNPVGAVHCGLVYGMVLAPGGTATVRETDGIEGSFSPLEQILEMCNNGREFESWSESVIRRSCNWSNRLF